MCQPYIGESMRGDGRSVTVTCWVEWTNGFDHEATRGKLIKVLYSTEF